MFMPTSTKPQDASAPSVSDMLRKDHKKVKGLFERYDAKFAVLAESVRHHIKEEELEMFPKAENCKIDWETLCSQVVKRKQQLIAKTRATSKTNQDKASKRK